MGAEKNDGDRDPNLSGPQMIGFTFWMAVFYFGTFFLIIVLAFVLADAVDDARADLDARDWTCLLYTSPSPRDLSTSRMPSSA